MKNIILLASLVVCSTSPVPCKYSRVINGTDDLNNEFPYVVSLESFDDMGPGIEKYRLCTGSLIAADWVLSAGHCMAPIVQLVRYGDMTLPRNATDLFSLVLKRLRHPNYIEPFLFKVGSIVQNDIGLIYIEKIDIGVGKISAVDCKTFIGRVATYAGFGVTSKEFTWQKYILDQKRRLQLGEGLVITCPTVKGRTWVPSLCLSPKCSDIYHDPAGGDSGGPLILNGKIVAVVSGGTRRPKTTIFTPVSPYLEWITRSVIQLN